MSCERIVTAAIIRRNDCVLLARRSSDQKLGGFWEFPGGKIEAGETPESCLARELREEMGIDIRVGRLFDESWQQYDHGSFRIVAYIAEWIAGDLRARIHDRVEWVKIDDIGAYRLLPADVPIAALLLDSED